MCMPENLTDLLWGNDMYVYVHILVPSPCDVFLHTGGSS